MADDWAVPKVHSHLIKTFPGSKFGIQLSLAVLVVSKMAGSHHRGEPKRCEEGAESNE